ncbi:hypothetical protein H4Q26_000751 [Puccinia striiformis f. sp. tritici PST-130]|nr:hypothetical protein H4Q26_000751 [Puccinia striiformis f. sp. tritici PST-130]
MEKIKALAPDADLRFLKLDITSLTLPIRQLKSDSPPCPFEASWLSRYQDRERPIPLLNKLNWFSSWVSSTPEQGAIPILYAATELEVEKNDLKSAYIGPFAQVIKPSKVAQDLDGTLGKKFWALCEALVRSKGNSHHENL